MSFFILVQNSLHAHEFSYLKKKKKDLDDTLVTEGREKVHHFHNDHQGATVLSRDLMTKDVALLDLNQTVKDAKQIMEKHNIHHLPLTEKQRVKGMVSASDLKDYVDDILLKDGKLKHFMTETVLCVSDETPLQHILEVFVHEYIHSLPVVDENLYLVGIITQTDIFKWMLKNRKYLK